MPQLGETVTEGTITRWFKQVGERVEVDEPLFEVSTDKVDSEVPAPQAGFVSEIVVPEGETVPVGARLAVISDASRRRAAGAPAPAPTASRAGASAAGTGGGRTASASSCTRACRSRARHPRRPPRRRLPSRRPRRPTAVVS